MFDDPRILIGIPLALLGAVFMSFGAQYQHRGVTKVEKLSGSGASGGLNGTQLKRLLTRPSWVVGTVMLGLAIVCQLAALSFAPLIVVQPLGAIALVITTLLNAQISGYRPTRRSLIAIAACVGGIFVFVTIAALYATDSPVSDRQLIVILILVAVVTIVFAGIWLWRRKRVGALFYITAAGVIYGFVATLAKVVITRIQTGDFEGLTFICLASLLLGRGDRRVLRADGVLVGSSRSRHRGTHGHRPDRGHPHRTHRPQRDCRRTALGVRRLRHRRRHRRVGCLPARPLSPADRERQQRARDPAGEFGRGGCRASGNRVDQGHRGGRQGLARSAGQGQGRRREDADRQSSSAIAMTMRPSSIRPLSPGEGAGAGIST